MECILALFFFFVNQRGGYELKSNDYAAPCYGV